MTLPPSPLECDVEVEADVQFSGEKWLTVIAYMLSMGVCGIVLVAIGSTFDDLASQIGRKTTSIGSVLIARGAGSIFGAVYCSKLYRWFPGNSVMLVSLLGIMVMLLSIPFTSTISQLHVFFFFLGPGTAITDTGCQLMTRKLHGKKAGPWLGANATVFGLSAALVPVLEIISSRLMTQYLILASIVALTCCIMLYSSQISKDGEHRPINFGVSTSDDADEEKEDPIVPHYYSEAAVSIMLFCFVGGSISATAYIESYIDQTGVISSRQKGTLVFLLWISITLGRIIGVQDQRSLTNAALNRHLSLLCIGGFLSMLLIYIFPQRSAAIWIGVALYGFFHGPTVGFCQDLNNRLTLPTEKSMAIVIFGLNCGASFVPYFTTVLWNLNDNGPIVLIIIIGLSMIVPLPLLYVAECVSYVEFRRQNASGLQSYESIDHGEKHVTIA